jgi:hypothetical protein
MKSGSVWPSADHVVFVNLPSRRGWGRVGVDPVPPQIDSLLSFLVATLTISHEYRNTPREHR